MEATVTHISSNVDMPESVVVMTIPNACDCKPIPATFSVKRNMLVTHVCDARSSTYALPKLMLITLTRSARLFFLRFSYYICGSLG